PFGRLEYTQRGTAPDGTPQYTATQTLSPQQQANNAMMGGLFGLGGSALGSRGFWDWARG
ncbi:MAG: hypothetical protein ACK5XN_28720, partial [Bacteroidota bacterium]